MNATYSPDDKDLARIYAIIDKSGGDGPSIHGRFKAISLATQMANAIQDPKKAFRRMRAADRAGEPDVADVFMKRWQELEYL